jgi:hypothetical protein
MAGLLEEVFLSADSRGHKSGYNLGSSVAKPITIVGWKSIFSTRLEG